MVQKIGLKAVLEMSSFQQGMRDYVSGIDTMTSGADDLAQTLVDAGVEIDTSFALISAAAIAAGTAVRRALAYVADNLKDATKEVYGNTQEWEALTKSYDNFWRSVVISAASRDELLAFFETLTGWINQASESALKYSASQEGYYAALNALIGAQEPGPLQDALSVLSQFGLGQVGQRAAGALAVWAENQGWLNEEVNLGQIYTDAYNSRLAENKRALDKASGATKDDAKAQKELQKILDELNKLRDQAADVQQNYARRVLESEEKLAQRTIDLNINRARRLEDLDLKLLQKRQQLAQQFSQRLTQIEAQAAEQSEQTRYDHAQRMAQIEQQYQERIRDIKTQYQESMYEAIASRDATAALRAMRQRDKELEEAKRDREQQRSEASTDYARQLELQRHNLDTQRQQALQAYQEQLANLKVSRQEQENELDRSLKRQLEDLERHNKWALAAMGREFSEEYKEAMLAYADQELLYAQHLMRMASIWQSHRGAFSLGPSGTSGYIGGHAEGGTFITGGPTTATFGEAGVPEMVTAVPLRGLYPDGGTVRHHLDPMQFDVAGRIEGILGGYEGRLSGAITEAVIRAFNEVLH